MKTHRALRAATPTDDAVRRLSDRALRAAALNPDHSDAARAAAAAELRARGAGVERWRISAPSFLAPADLARGEQLFFGVAAQSRRASGGVAIASGAGGVASAAVAFFAGASSASIAALVLGGVSIAAALVWVVAAAFRTKPARILLLAPSLKSTALRRMIARELTPFGHIVTFKREASDGAVRSATDYRARVRAMRNLIGMNISAMLAPETLPLSASDGWRDMTFDVALTSSDAIVADLSEDAEQTLRLLAESEALSRCAFVCIWGRLDDAEAALRRHQIDAICFYYAPDGEMQRRASFRAAILAALRVTHGVIA